jgi:acetolactate synthase I/II/III large subunit
MTSRSVHADAAGPGAAPPPGPPTRMTGGQALARQLELEGVEVIFGLPGDQLMHALDGLQVEGRIPFLVTRHEQATTYMADGYARTAGRPGTAMVVPGVGVYNAGAGLATAYACSSPVFLLAGQVNRHGIGNDLGLLHDVHDQLDLVRPVTKWARRVLDPAEIPGAVREAFRQMATGRPRPVELEIPPETFSDEADVTLVDPVAVEPDPVDPDAIARAAALLASARTPLIVAGGGAVLGDATAVLRDVAEHLQAAVVTTREGKGAIDDRHPLSVGTMWVNKRLRPVLDGADVVLAVGTRLQGFGFGPTQRVVHVDVDADQIGRNHPAEVAVVGHATVALTALLAALRERGDAHPSRTAETTAARREVEAALRAVGPQGEMVDALRRAIPDDAVVVPDTTTIGYMCHMLFPVHAPRTYLSTSYMGTLGFAYPTSLGAKVARPDAPVVALVGDGGFLFAATEMATAVQHGIHTVTVVFDDGAYGNSNRDQRERFGGREYGTLLQNPDFAALARAFGVEGVQLRDAGQLEGAVREAVAERDRSTLVVCPMERLPSPF